MTRTVALSRHFRSFSAAFLVTVATSSNAFSQPSRNEVIGYFPSWKWQADSTVMTVGTIPFDKVTIINYAFWYPHADGKIRGRDTTGDAVFLRGPMETRLVDRAHARGGKVMLSLGGWDDSGEFPAVASTEALRITFSHSCLEAIRQYGFDGIDIDWEYPGFADHQGTPADRMNFPLLLRSLRDSLDAQGRRTGKMLLLTAALPASAVQLRGVDMPLVCPLLDQVNLMTYDYHGTWENVSGHNSPLYASSPDDSLLCVNASFRLYTETLKVPPSKLNLGVPFYGHAYRGCSGLRKPAAGPDTSFGLEGSFYSAIARSAGRFTRYWDDTACVPYLISNDGTAFVSYDDERSIRLKAEYVKEHHARGLIIWELTQDYGANGATPLLDAIDAVFRSGSLPH
jgi:chitinase